MSPHRSSFPVMLSLSILLTSSLCCVSSLKNFSPVGPINPAYLATPNSNLPATEMAVTTTPASSISTAIPIPINQTPTVPVAPQLLSNGPYLAFLRDAGNGLDLVLMDADGKGEMVTSFPQSIDMILPGSLSSLLSPDGTHLAYFTGSAGPAFGQGGTTSGDLALNLVTLSTPGLQAGGSQVITLLLSKDYPANFDRLAKQIANSDISVQSLRDSFVAGITQSIAWSPDGVNLAFAGQMDGDSSDLYVYNVRTQSITRLSSGPENVQWIDWSPNGKWILDGSAYQVGEGMTYDVFATLVDGSVTRQVMTDSTLSGGPLWINSHVFITYQSSNGPGNHDITRVDILTGKADKVYVPSFNYFNIDARGDYLIIRPADGGLVLINLATLERVHLSQPDLGAGYRSDLGPASIGAGAGRKIILRDNGDSSLYFVSTSGDVTPVGIKADTFSVAPNHESWIAIGEDVKLFVSGGSSPIAYKLPAGLDGIQRIIWRPDSSGVFIVSASRQLFGLDLSSGASGLVEPALATKGPADLIWVH
jgi:hypothetical protein